MKHRLLMVAGVVVGLAATLFTPALAAQGPLFTHEPTHIQNVAGIIALGSLNPGGDHVIAVDHMYIGYLNPNTGVDVDPVFAMAAGKIVMMSRKPVEAPYTGWSYQIFIQHDSDVTSYFDHVHVLSGRIVVYLARNQGAWVSVGGNGLQIMVFGQEGAPVPLQLAAGEQVGETKSYSATWDVGVIDKRRNPNLIGSGPRRYPGFVPLFDAAGLTLVPPAIGNKTTKAACFMDYMGPAKKAAWLALLVSHSTTCSGYGWDVAGSLRGEWFNPAVDVPADPPVFDLEQAVVSIVPDSFHPATHVQIGLGSGGTYSALDPAGAHSQLGNPFPILIDTTPGTLVNPDPAAVTPTTGTVCYDLAYIDVNNVNRNDTLLLSMPDAQSVAMKYDPGAYTAPQCASMTLPVPDGTWVIYKR